MNLTATDFGIPSLTTLLAIAAIFLGLALIVQVIQDVFKYLISSKAKVYRMVLRDFFGPWVDQLYEAGPAARFQVRGPFQFFKSRPTGVLIPLAKEELLAAIDSVAPDWLGYTLEALKSERRLQAGGPAEPSPQLVNVAANLAAAAKKEPLHSNARRMLEFLKEWKVVNDSGALLREEVDASRLLEGLYQRFFPDRVRADQEFSQLERNFKHAYDRRNLRYTLILGLLVAVFFNFPFDTLYERASAMSAEQAVDLADAVLEAESRINELTPLDAETTEEEAKAAIQKRRELLEKLVRRIDSAPDEEVVPLYQRGTERVAALWQGANRATKISSYLLNCLVTALLISFGAPFWHRLTEALLAVRRGKPPANAEEA